MPISTHVDEVAKERGVSKLSASLAKLKIPSKDLHALWKPQIKLFRPFYPDAAKILCDVPIPEALTDPELIQLYVRSTPITPAGTHYTPQTSEILPGKLWIADRFSGTDSSTLQRLNITHVICMGPEGYHRYCPSLTDVVHQPVIVPLDLYNTMVGFIDDIVTHADSILRADPSNRLLVHCVMGMDWSPSIAVAMLMNETGCSFPEAVDIVQAKRESSRLHMMVEKAIQEWWTLEQLRPELPPGRGYRAFRWAVEESEDTE